MNGTARMLTAEEKLLLSLCRLDFNEEQKSEIRDLMKEIKDWDHFVELLNEHGIIALAAYNIRKTRLAGLVEEKAMQLLDNGCMQSTVRNAWLTQRWKEANSFLSDAGIKHVLLKGMALEHTVYGARGLRQMTDNDILVKKENAMKAWLLLQKHGFIPEMIKSPLHTKVITDIGKHLPTLTKDGYAVEIHHRLFNEAAKNKTLDEAIDNSNKIDVEGTEAFILNDDIHLEYLKEHLYYHQISEGSQLRLYLDIELIEPGSMPQFEDGSLIHPDQTGAPGLRKSAFRANYYSMPPQIRLLFLAGDIFPSLKWMKQRYGCGTLKALLLYPGRIGKVLWVIKG